MPQWRKRLLRCPQPRARLRRHRHAAAGSHGAAKHAATDHVAVDAAAQHDTAAEHAAAAHHGAATVHVAVDATEQHDAVDPDGIKLPQLGKGLHSRPQPRARLRGLDATDNPGAVERHAARNYGEARHDSARPGRLLPGADHYPPGPPRADHSASPPAVLSAAAPHLPPHGTIRRPHQPADWRLLGPRPRSTASATAGWLRLEQRPRPWRPAPQLGRPTAHWWVERAAASRWLEPTLARTAG
jgi:hypothetical protein